MCQQCPWELQLECGAPRWGWPEEDHEKRGSGLKKGATGKAGARQARKSPVTAAPGSLTGRVWPLTCGLLRWR